MAKVRLMTTIALCGAQIVELGKNYKSIFDLIIHIPN